MSASQNESILHSLVRLLKRYAAWMPLLAFLVFASVQATYRSVNHTEKGQSSAASLGLDCQAYCQGFLNCVAEYQPALKAMRHSNEWQQAASACEAGCHKQAHIAASCQADVIAGRCTEARSCLDRAIAGGGTPPALK